VRVPRTALAAFVGFWAGVMAAAAIVKRIVRSRGDAESDEVALVAIFDGIGFGSRATSFRGGSMWAWYGGISVDLRNATLSPEGAHLDLYALSGGIDITVPEGWHVESRLNAFGGGVDAPPAADGDGPTLTLEGFALFGGVSVSAKPAP